LIAIDDCCFRHYAPYYATPLRIAERGYAFEPLIYYDSDIFIIIDDAANKEEAITATPATLFLRHAILFISADDTLAPQPTLRHATIRRHYVSASLRHAAITPPHVTMRAFI